MKSIRCILLAIYQFFYLNSPTIGGFPVLKAAFLGIGLISSVQAWSRDFGDLKKLKLYRTYYDFKLESPAAHLIQVYFQVPNPFGALTWENEWIGIQADQDLTQLAEKDFLYIGQGSVIALGGGSGRKPPHEYRNLPANLEFKRGEIESAIKRILKDDQPTNFVMVYYGYEAVVSVRETVPWSKGYIGPGTFGELLDGFESTHQYFFDPMTRHLELVSASSQSTVLFNEEIRKEQVQNIPWWNFELPATIEGSSLFAIENYTKSFTPLHLETYKRLMKSIARATELALEGTPVHSTLDSIIARQSDSVLPAKFQQVMEYNVFFCGYSSDPKRTKNLHGQFSIGIPLEATFFSETQTDLASGISVKLEGRLLGDDAGLKLTFTDTKDHSVSVQLKVDNVDLVEVEGKKTADFIGLTSDTDLDERLAFPGNDIYERFEIDLRDELKRFPLTGI